MTEAHFALAFPTVCTLVQQRRHYRLFSDHAVQVGWSHPDSVTFMVMQSLLGSWDRTASAGGFLCTITVSTRSRGDDNLIKITPSFGADRRDKQC